MSFYVHGLNFDSAIDLDATHPLSANKAEPVEITYGDVSSDGLEKPTQTHGLTQVAQSKIWINVPNIARYHISDGSKITVEASPNADKASINTFIESMAISGALYQRGLTPLQACAIKIGDSAVIIAGSSGVGKSTTAAAFHQRGYQIISDDIVSINQQGHAHFGFSRLKLWEDSLTHLEIAFESVNQVRDNIRKYSAPCSKPKSLSPIPIKAIYLLEQANAANFSSIELSPLKGISNFVLLKNLTQCTHFLESSLRKPLLLKALAALSRCPTAKIVRPTTYFSADCIVDTVLKHVNSHK